jgi:hypothetical protein
MRTLRQRAEQLLGGLCVVPTRRALAEVMPQLK